MRFFNHSVVQLFLRFKSKINRDVLTYLVFLLIAIVIWYLNALNKDYTAEMKFAVRYTDLPDDKVLTNTPPKYLTLTINAQGFTLLKYRLGLIFNPMTLEASYQTLRRKNSSPQGEYFLITQSMFDRIALQLSSNVSLRNVAPDTLNFLLSETIKKKIPVKPALQLQFDKGFFPRGNMLIEPSVITVTGPKALVDTMQYVYTQTRVFKKLKDTLKSSVELQPVHLLQYSVGEALIEQTIERYTEATITAPIEPINLPGKTTMKMFPGTITINCMVPVVNYENLHPNMFRAVVDYNSVKDAMDNQAKAKVNVLRMPDYVIDVKFNPKNVDFIIEK